MNINYKLYILPVFLFAGLVSCATNSDNLKADGFTWKIPFDGSNSAPIIYKGTIYIGSFDGVIYAINPKNGKEVWRYQTGKTASRDNAIYISGKSFGDMMGAALDVATKKGKGIRQISATPVIKDGIVYIGSKDYNFYALDAKTGKLKWVTGIDQPIWEKALVTDKHIIIHGFGIGLSPGAIYILRKTNGQIMWSSKDWYYTSYPASIGVLFIIVSEKNLNLQVSS